MYGHPLTIVGIMPSEIMSPEPGRPIDMAVPMMLSDPAKMRDRSSLWLEIVARLKPGVRTEQAREEANALFQGYMTDVQVSPEVRKLLFDHVEVTSGCQGIGRPADGSFRVRSRR